MERAIGVDLHSNMFIADFFSLETGQHRQKRYKLSDIELFRKELCKDDCVGVEATGNTRYFVKQIRDSVECVKIINPSQFKVVSDSVNKTDKRDAKIIAEFLSKDMVPEVRMKSDRAAELYSVAQTRDKLVKLRTVLKNKVHSLLNTHGIAKTGRLSSNKALAALADLPLPRTAQLELNVIVTQIKNLSEGIRELEKELEAGGPDLEGHENITSIKGIAANSGTILLSVIDDIHNFENEKKLFSYFGIVPRVSSSNDKHHTGHITKHGSKLGRTTLVQCTMSAIKYSPVLNEFYHRIEAKKGKGKAKIATSKKLLGVIYHTLINNWVFEDFPNGILKSPS